MGDGGLGATDGAAGRSEAPRINQSDEGSEQRDVQIRVQDKSRE
jgi:hypothetical protein